MSAFAGIVRLDGGPADPALLARMAAVIARSAPDGTRSWSQGPAALAHALLRTGDPVAEVAEPFTLGGGSWIVTDARIDGRAELVRTFAAGGGSLDPRASAAEVLLRAWNAWGDGAVDHLFGDFAFAIWDAERRRLVCARDAFGVKPFFYAVAGGDFVFSSSLDAVRRHPAVSARVDEAWIGDFFVHGDPQDTTSTAFSDIRRLPPGHLLTVEDGQVRTRRWWRLPQDEPLLLRRPGDYVERFVGLLDEAVRDRLPDGPAGIFLSGGRDSTALAATARALVDSGARASDLRAYTAVQVRTMADEEGKYAALAASALRIPNERLVADDYGPLAGWRRSLLPRPEPADAALLAVETDQLASASRQGRVVFTGQGGDAVLRESRSRLVRLLAAGRPLRAVREAAEYAWLHRRLPRPGVRTWLRERSGERPWAVAIPGWVRPELVARTGLDERVAAYNAPRPPMHPFRPEAAEQLLAPLWPALLSGYDPAVTGLPIEVRHPFFDLRLVRFLLSIPPAQWYNDKGLLRLGMRGRLPEAVLRRPKTPLPDDPLAARLRTAGERWLEGLVAGPEVEPWVDLARVPAVAGGASPAPSGDLWSDLRPLTLSLWLREHE